MGPRLTDLFLRSQSDERLVSLARAGHERAFAVIVERYRAELEAFARSRNSDGRAEDIVQQAFLGAFAALQSGAEVSHLRGWLYRIVRNEASKTRPNTEVPLDAVSACGESLEDVVQRRAVALAALSELNALPGRQREALVATALRGSTRADVARTMDLSEGAVRQLVHRARHAVRTAVTALTPYPLAQLWSGSGAATDASLAAGAASAGGVAVKLGALLASGVVATGIATTVQGSQTSHRTTPRASVLGHAGTPRNGSVLLASAATGLGSRHGSGDGADEPGARHEGSGRSAAGTSRGSDGSRGESRSDGGPGAGGSVDRSGDGSRGGSRGSTGGSGASRGGGPDPSGAPSSDAGQSSTGAGERGVDSSNGSSGESSGGPGPSGSSTSGDGGSGTSGGPGSTGSSGSKDGSGSPDGAGSTGGPGSGGSSGSTEAVGASSDGPSISTDGAFGGSGDSGTTSGTSDSAGGGGSTGSDGGPEPSAVAASASDGGPQPSALGATGN